MFHTQHPQKEAGTSAGKEGLAISQSVELGQCQHLKNHGPELKNKVLCDLAVTP